MILRHFDGIIIGFIEINGHPNGFQRILMDLVKCRVFEWILVNFHGGSPLIRFIVSKPKNQIRLGCG